MGYLGGGTSTNKYQYNGKELNNDFEMYFYDYGARFYDPAIGRWSTPDPMAEIYYNISPYAYCANDPIKYIDNNGLWPTKKVVDNGRVGNRGFSLDPVMNPYHKVYRPHKGQDFPVPEGNNIHALAEGTISNIGYNKGGWGYYVDIKHSDGYTTRYAHLQKGGIKVKNGDRITDGELIALSGMTGGATGPHLHLEVLLNGKPINPMYIADLQELLKENDGTSEIINDNNPIELPEVDILGKSSHSKPLEMRDLDWQFARSNAYGNTGRYNKEGRTSDQYYSDDFLKWYYGKK